LLLDRRSFYVLITTAFDGSQQASNVPLPGLVLDLRLQVVEGSHHWQESFLIVQGRIALSSLVLYCLCSTVICTGYPAVTNIKYGKAELKIKGSLM
jgi:hypothetical protein